MINSSTILPDEFDDEILVVLKAIDSRSKWDKKKHFLRDQLVELLKSKRYMYFFSSYSRYYISRVGESYLYDVPLYKRGNLSKFKGKRVRIVCTESGRHTNRTYMAGVIQDTPQEKIITKLTYRYTFPDYVNSHEMIYKSPRFIVFHIDNKVRIFSEDASGGYIDIEGWDSILVDGKFGLPIATLSINKDGAVRGKHIRWLGERTFDSLRDAIIYFRKSG